MKYKQSTIWKNFAADYWEQGIDMKSPAIRQ